jgi:hypothetical protein
MTNQVQGIKRQANLRIKIPAYRATLLLSKVME